MPALFTRTSSRPQASTVAATAAFTSSSRAVSPRRNRARPRAAAVLDPPRRGGARLLVLLGDEQRRPLGREQPRDRPADAGASARHQNRLALELHSLPPSGLGQS